MNIKFNHRNMTVLYNLIDLKINRKKFEAGTLKKLSIIPVANPQQQITLKDHDGPFHNASPISFFLKQTLTIEDVRFNVPHMNSV